MVSTTTFIPDSVLYIRDLLTTITDPISAKRGTGEKFVLTSYPRRTVQYPIITVKAMSTPDIQRLGMRSEMTATNVRLEIRAWARNESEKDTLTTDIINKLRGSQFSGSTPSENQELHDLMILSSVPIDEAGEAGIKSQVLTISYMFILGVT